jgi:predicted small secreted protein
MTSDLIEKYVEIKENIDKPINIFFKQRNSIKGLFIQLPDYNELKAKNFWRIVYESKIAEWKQTKDINLARLFSGSDFSRLK